ncbi:MAG: GTP-binding protein [Treponema sp.]
MFTKTIPVTLLTGYLGSGKTTLLNHILNNQNGWKAAVIVNDIGEVNIDQTLIENNGRSDAESVIPLSNGCICCTLKKDLMKQIQTLIHSEKYDYIVIEASGICEPAPIAQAVTQLEGSRLDNIVTIVDALRLADEFGCGEKLVKSYDETHNIEHRQGSSVASSEEIERLLVQQIEFCTTIIINKIDTVTEEQLKTVRSAVRHLQPSAKVMETTFGKIDFRKILNTNSFDFDTVYKSAGWIQAMQEDEDGKPETEEFGITTFVYSRRKPFIRELFDLWMKQIPRNIIRAKGIVWFSARNNRSYVFEEAGCQEMTREFGRWNDGDQQIKLVFIGRKMDWKKLETDLDSCLKTH